ncbi:carotenoid oxygenase family protein [Myxococcota bacterium]|nr:carotenoid oxygenase family protein [Myxococcota bacterium]
MSNPFLTGNYGPVEDETTAFDLPVEGRIPDELAGRLLRIGPNPVRSPGEKHHWFSGNGLVHGVKLQGGKALWYRSRFVRDDEVCDARGWPRTQGPRFSPFSGGVANTNVISHAGRTFAIVEAGGNPVELDEELETLGYSDFSGTLPGPFSAHPKRDPDTGELHATGYFPGWDHLQYVVVGTDGVVCRTVDIPVDGHPMIHDCGITENHFIVFDFPVLFDPKMVEQGYSLPYRWHADRAARVGLLRRDDVSSAVVWHEVEPCFVFHPMNAYEDDEGQVILDVVRHPKLFDAEHLEVDQRDQTLERWRIDTRGGRVSEDRLCDRPQEFPRHDERRIGKPYRYGYCGSSDREGLFGGLLKHDLNTGRATHRDEGPSRSFQEAVFVPCSDEADEDDGWLLAYVHDAGRNAADVVILHAQDFLGEPVARIELPTRVPWGFHGNWVPDT